jgi:hypothetical protein
MCANKDVHALQNDILDEELGQVPADFTSASKTVLRKSPRA